MLVCEQITQTFDNSWNEYIHHQVKEQQKKCKKWPWPLSWLCSIFWKLIEWTETIFHLIISVILTTICHTIQLFIMVVKTLFDLFVDLVLRLLGWFDFVAGLFGILPIKKLRLHVVILMKSDGQLTTTVERANESIARAREILRARARIKLIAAVHVMDEPAPHYALQVKTGVGFFVDQLSDTGAYFWQVIETKMPGLLPQFWLRIATPIVAFITEGIGGEEAHGCAGLLLGDCLFIEGAYTGPRATLAHEIGHDCGLLHDEFDTTNLMYPSDPLANNMARGTNLSPFQRGILRGSTHVTYF